MACRMMPQARLLRNPKIDRVFVQPSLFVEAAIWLERHGQGHYCVGVMHPEEGRPVSEFVHLLTHADTAFELKMRFA